MTDTAASLSGVNAGPLPEPIVATLRQAIRRRRSVIIMRGLLAVAAVAIASLLAVMAVDAAVTIFSTTMRWLMTGAGVAAVLAAVGWFLVRPLARGMTFTRIARMIETHHPELEERISSAVELLTSSDAPELLGSGALIAELIKEATAEVRVVEPSREFSARSARPWLIATCSVAVVLAGLWLIWPEPTSRLFVRAIAPYADVGTVGALRLNVTPGDAVLATGDSLRVVATVEGGGVRSARLLRTDNSGDETSLPMTQLSKSGDSSARFGLTLASGSTNFRYRVLAGEDARSQHYRVIVSKRPAVTVRRLRYVFPDYTGLAEQDEKNAGGAIRAVIGSTVTLTATFNKPVDSAEMLINGKPVPGGRLLTKDGARTATWRVAMTAGTKGEWWLKLTDKLGLRSQPDSHEIRALPDEAPVVTVTEPKTSQLRLSRTDQLRILYEVQEDYGVSAAVLLVRIDNEPVKRIPVERPRPSSLTEELWLGRAALALSELDLRQARQVQFHIEVTDTLPLPKPQRGVSKTYTIVLDEKAPSYVAQWVDARVKEIEASLNEALRELKQAKRYATDMIPRIAAEPLALSQHTTNAVDGVRRHTAKADEVMLRVAEEAAVPEFVRLASRARQVAEEYIAPARKAAEMIRLAGSKTEQNEQAKTSDEYIDKAIAAVEKMFDELKDEAERVRRAEELAARADRLARELRQVREAVEEGQELPTAEELRRAIAGRIADEQKEIAAEAAELARHVDASPWKEGSQHNEAATSAQQTSDHLQSENMSEAATSGKRAAGEFKQVANKLGEDQPGQQPGQQPDQAQQAQEQQAQAQRQQQAGKAGDLARRQERVNEQMDALEKGDFARAIESMQNDLAERMAKLAEDAQNYKEGLSPSDPAKENADLASKEFDSAAQDTQDAAQQWAKMPLIPRGKYIPPKVVSGPQSPSENPSGDPEGGQGTKGGGSNTGAGSSKKPSPSNLNQNNTMGPGQNLGKATLTAEPGMPQSQGPSGGSGTELTKEAEEALRNGSLALQGEENPEAKGTGGMGGEGEGEDGQEGMDGQGQMAGKPGGRGGKSGKGAKLGRGRGRVAGRLKRMGISASDWLRLPSSLRSEILKAADERAPEEYRGLVKRYFQTLAKRGNGRQPK